MESDFDIAVAADRPLTIDERRSLRRRFSESLEAHFPLWSDLDLVDITAVPLTLAMQVLQDGIVLQCANERSRAFLETRLMSQYAALNEERREILEDIVKRGRVYA